MGLSRDRFREGLRRGELRPILREIPTASVPRLYEAVRSPGTLLLDSVRGPATLARHSILAVDPYAELRVKDGRVLLRTGDRNTLVSTPPLSTLRRLLHTDYRVIRPDELPFVGGAVGLISYDFVRYLERLPRTTVDDLAIPDLHLFFTDTVVTFDHIREKVIASVLPAIRTREPGAPCDMDPDALHAAALERLENLATRLGNAPGSRPEPDAPAPASIPIEHETGAARYHEMVRRAKTYIAAGDIFQTNLSQRLRAPIGDLDPWRIYRTLRNINPSPFAAYADMGDYQIASSSPERLVRVDPSWIETRPIAGTRPRGDDAEGDRRMRAELLINEKERAEHIMLIDLERNDLGKIARYGSVEVNELMVTEDYSHVIHIVSNVRGRLVDGKDPSDVIRAVFPGGTITGVPKVRCMEIIDELEQFHRGPYTGSLGYIGFDGTMDLNIIIRTFVVKDGWAYVQAGAGIVADSDPEREYHETIKKAEALIRTVERL